MTPPKAPDYSYMQAIQQQQFTASLQQMQSESAEAARVASQKQAQERAAALAAEQAAEAERQAAAKKKAEASFVRKSVVTSPFGLTSQANTASRSFGLTSGASK